MIIRRDSRVMTNQLLESLLRRKTLKLDEELVNITEFKHLTEFNKFVN